MRELLKAPMWEPPMGHELVIERGRLKEVMLGLLMGKLLVQLTEHSWEFLLGLLMGQLLV